MINGVAHSISQVGELHTAQGACEYSPHTPPPLPQPHTHVHTDLCMPCCGDFPLFFPLLYCCQTPLDFVHENVMGTLKCPHNYGEVIL